MKETTVLVVIVLENIMSQETETKSNNDSHKFSVKTRITATKLTALSICMRAILALQIKAV